MAERVPKRAEKVAPKKRLGESKVLPSLQTLYGSILRPVATFNEGYSNWCIEGPSYVLYTGASGAARETYHISEEARKVLVTLPSPREVEAARLQEKLDGSLVSLRKLTKKGPPPRKAKCSGIFIYDTNLCGCAVCRRNKT